MPELQNLHPAVWGAIIVAVAAVLLLALSKGAGISLGLGSIFRADVSKGSDRTVKVGNDLDATGAKIGNITGVKGDPTGVRELEVGARARLKNTTTGDITGVDARSGNDAS